MKKISKEKIVLCFLVGVLLLVIAIPIEKNETKSASQETSGTIHAQSVNISDNAALLEAQLEWILAQMEGIGQVESMITLEPFVDDKDVPEIRGILILADCGDNPVEILKIQETVMTLFQISAHRIKVMKLK